MVVMVVALLLPALLFLVLTLLDKAYTDRNVMDAVVHTAGFGREAARREFHSALDALRRADSSLIGLRSSQIAARPADACAAFRRTVGDSELTAIVLLGTGGRVLVSDPAAA